MIGISSVTLTVLFDDGCHGGFKQFTKISDANAYIEKSPDTRFEFEVAWTDGTKQKGRLTNRTVTDWLGEWAKIMLTNPKHLVVNPGLIKQANRLTTELSIN